MSLCVTPARPFCLAAHQLFKALNWPSSLPHCSSSVSWLKKWYRRLADKSSVPLGRSLPVPFDGPILLDVSTFSYVDSKDWNFAVCLCTSWTLVQEYRSLRLTHWVTHQLWWLLRRANTSYWNSALNWKYDKEVVFIFVKRPSEQNWLLFKLMLTPEFNLFCIEIEIALFFSSSSSSSSSSFWKKKKHQLKTASRKTSFIITRSFLISQQKISVNDSCFVDILQNWWVVARDRHTYVPLIYEKDRNRQSFLFLEKKKLISHQRPFSITSFTKLYNRVLKTVKIGFPIQVSSSVPSSIFPVNEINIWFY